MGIYCRKCCNAFCRNFEKAFSAKQVFWGIDTDTPLVDVVPTTQLSPSVTSIQGGTVQIMSNEVFDYIALTVTRTSTSITTSSVTFTGVNIKQAPSGSGLTTTKDNFYFFINGQYIPSSDVASIVDDGTTVVVTFINLPFSLDSVDTVVAVGKFLVL